MSILDTTIHNVYFKLFNVRSMTEQSLLCSDKLRNIFQLLFPALKACHSYCRSSYWGLVHQMTSWLKSMTLKYLQNIIIIVTGSGKIQHFAEIPSKFEILLYLASIMSVFMVSMSIYDCIVSELQHFVMQPLIPAILRTMHVQYTYSQLKKLIVKMLDFCRLVTIINRKSAIKCSEHFSHKKSLHKLILYIYLSFIIVNCRGPTKVYQSWKYM